MGFSALQRAEIAEIEALARTIGTTSACFSALQRAEIAEIIHHHYPVLYHFEVSVLFNEPKLLKLRSALPFGTCAGAVSVLFNEPKLLKSSLGARGALVR